MARRRSRIVSFRLSEDEYESLKSISSTRGANSVSEYTRSAAFSADAEANGDGAGRIENILLLIRDKLENLGLKLQQMIDGKNQ
jgi:hypothetical protein